MTRTTTPTAAGASAQAGGHALAGAGMMLLGLFLFAANDALGKWLVGTYSVGQVLLIRSIAALLVLLPFAWRAGRRAFARAPRPGLQALRVVCSALEVALFYWAVALLPLAEVMTYYLAGPIYVTALSPLLLGERVGWRRWTAVLVGFGGVVVALGPSGAAFSPAALPALAGSFAFALLMIATRKLAATDGTVLLTLQVATALAFGLVLAPLHWVPIAPLDHALLGVLGVVSMTAYLCVNKALALAPASTLAPLQYTLIVWGVLLGYVVFGEVPRAATLLGAAIIVATGLFIVFRERALARAGAREEAGQAGPPPVNRA